MTNQEFYQAVARQELNDENEYPSIIVGRIDQRLTEDEIKKNLMKVPQFSAMEQEKISEEEAEKNGSRYFSLVKQFESENEMDHFTVMLVGGNQDDTYLYQISIIPSNPSVKFNEFMRSEPISDQLIDRANSAPYEIMVESFFGDDLLNDYLMQLKILQAIAPKVLLVCDISAASRIFTPQWLKFQTEGNLPPALENLYTIHGTYDETDEGGEQYWFHTHGLLRCGFPELEVIIPNDLPHDDATHYIGHLFESVVGAWIDRLMDDPIGGSTPVAQTSEVIEYAFAIPWEEGLNYVGEMIELEQIDDPLEASYELPDQATRRFLGDYNDRDESHSHPSCILFKEVNESGYLQDFITDYSESDDIVFMKSNEETERMVKTAQERWSYLHHFFDHHGNSARKQGLLGRLFNRNSEKEWGFIVKCGFYDESSDSHEHLWFELVKAHADSLQGELISTPYWIQDLEINQQYTIPLEQVSGWQIYYQGKSFDPYTIYQLLQ